MNDLVDIEGILSTTRLAIRQFELTDAEFVLRLLNEESFLRFIGDKRVRTVKEARDYLSNGPIASYHSDGFGLFHVAEISSGQSIGICGLLQREGQEYPDIGFAFLPEYCAQGFAFESAQAVLDYGSTVLGIETIVAFVSPENHRSIHVLERLGMSCVGATSMDGSLVTQYAYYLPRSARRLSGAV